MGAVGGVAVQAGGVAPGLEKVVATDNFRAVVEPLRGGAFQSELVPGAQQTAVVLPVVVEVGVFVVESPVGDADDDIFARVGLRQPQARLHTVGAGIAAGAVQRWVHTLRDAVLQDFGTVVYHI